MAKFRWKRVFSRRIRTLAKADAARDRLDPSMAAYFYQKVINGWGKSYPILMQLGNALKDSGQFLDAERTYFEAIAIQPHEDDTFLQLGHLMKTTGQLEKAESFYQNALDINPMATDARLERDKIIESRVIDDEGRSHLSLRTDMPLPASIVHHRLINQYRWRRG